MGSNLSTANVSGTGNIGAANRSSAGRDGCGDDKGSARQNNERVISGTKRKVEDKMGRADGARNHNAGRSKRSRISDRGHGSDEDDNHGNDNNLNIIDNRDRDNKSNRNENHGLTGVVNQLAAPRPFRDVGRAAWQPVAGTVNHNTTSTSGLAIHVEPPSSAGLTTTGFTSLHLQVHNGGQIRAALQVMETRMTEHFDQGPAPRVWISMGVMPQSRGPSTMDRMALRLMQQRPAPSEVLTGNECAWCLKRAPEDVAYAATHQLKDCVWPTNSGEIPGCPVCNDANHYFDNCPVRASMGEEERRQQALDVLVRNRGGLPPHRSAIPWPQLVADTEQPQLESGFPATKAFARAQLRADKGVFQRHYSAANKPVRLLNDPATGSIDAIREHLPALVASEVFQRFVQRCGDANEGTADPKALDKFLQGSPEPPTAHMTPAVITSNTAYIEGRVLIKKYGGRYGSAPTTTGNAGVVLAAHGTVASGVTITPEAGMRLTGNVAQRPPDHGVKPGVASSATFPMPPDSDSEPGEGPDYNALGECNGHP